MQANKARRRSYQRIGYVPSRVAHCARPSRKGVKRLRVWPFIDWHSSAQLTAEATITLNTLTRLREMVYNVFRIDGFVMR